MPPNGNRTQPINVVTATLGGGVIVVTTAVNYGLLWFVAAILDKLGGENLVETLGTFGVIGVAEVVAIGSYLACIALARWWFSRSEFATAIVSAAMGVASVFLVFVMMPKYPL